MILGTAAYMSPEQAKGKAVDKRSDVWAFGCVLFEMLSGQQTFGGETLTDTLAAVVRAEPDWDALPAATPGAIRRLLRRCLIKDAKQRLRDIGEARIAQGPAICAKAAGGNGEPEILAKKAEVPAFSPDGAYMVYLRSGDGALMKLRLTKDSQPEIFSDVLTLNPRISPDSHYISYYSWERGGRSYIRAFPTGVAKWEVPGSSEGLTVWHPNGKELFYEAIRRRLWQRHLKRVQVFPSVCRARSVTLDRIRAWGLT